MIILYAAYISLWRCLTQQESTCESCARKNGFTTRSPCTISTFTSISLVFSSTFTRSTDDGAVDPATSCDRCDEFYSHIILIKGRGENKVKSNHRLYV